MISFRISHYILILSTPLAILIAHALLEGPYSVRPAFRRALKGFFIFLLAIGVFAVSFIFVFLAGMSNVWLVVYSCGVVAAAVSVFRSRDPLVPPGLLAFFLIFVLFQSNSISRTGLCPHAVYQRLAQAVHTEINPDYIVAVASHSLHEKEFQIHFDRQVVKTGHGYEPLTRVNLLNLLKDHPTVYCLITEADYNKYRLDLEAFPHEIIADALIFRKSLALDKGFIMAVARLDRARIQAYLMERILLMRKDPNALVR